MYVVAGVSGKTGKVVADTLVGRGKPVRVIVRDAAKARPWAERGAGVVVADFEDTGALTRALRDATGAYLLLPPPGPGATGVVARARRLTASLKQAIAKSGARHVVFLSSLGAESPDTGMAATLYEAERELGTLPTPLTFLRAAYLLESWGASLRSAVQAGVLPTFLAPDRPVAMVAARDVGLVAARSLLEPPAGHEIIDLVGPRDYSATAVAALLGQLLGRTVTVQSGRLEAMVPALQSYGFSAEMGELYRELVAAINEGRVAAGGGRLVRGGTTAEEVFGAILRAAQ
jgi:uncharacterized protein YbjT (DUF2867 family)